jgi:hypothetical protein
MIGLSFEEWQQRERALVVPPADTREEFTGELLDYLRARPGFERAYIVHHAYDRRYQSHLQNPWVLWFSLVNGAHLPSKMPLWLIERTLAERPLAWAAVPPAQGDLF